MLLIAGKYPVKILKMQGMVVLRKSYAVRDIEPGETLCRQAKPGDAYMRQGGSERVQQTKERIDFRRIQKRQIQGVLYLFCFLFYFQLKVCFDFVYSRKMQ